MTNWSMALADRLHGIVGWAGGAGVAVAGGIVSRDVGAGSGAAGTGSGVAGMAAPVLVVVLAIVPGGASSEPRDPKVNQAPVTRTTSPHESRLPGAG
jgi:hypothetical protein